MSDFDPRQTVRLELSAELEQYLAFLATVQGIRDILGKLTYQQEERLCVLREDLLAKLTPEDRSNLRVAMGTEKPEQSSSKEEHWATKRGSVR